ncbi:putative F420-0 ABC transporter permease subunit [Pelagibacterium lacus]|uniref:Iron ABC transporter permease n=1 Tax=Pelagibacterium lacus TaxID=2282655 RepID=A0A369W3R7_9HYPH|nr:putative F420-0 ABC transporter permease subunit [Pelagibacterium lacus]RDE08679.1 iron ABC transporter permease [Pelagibacterium lacus]
MVAAAGKASALTLTALRRLKFRIWMLGLMLALAASLVVAVTIGPAAIGPGEVWAVIAHKLGLIADSPVSRLREGIVWELRLPRVLAAAAVGAGLAICGATMQALTRNPLADPYLLGLSSGASVGAVAMLLAGATLLLPLGAFLGALAAMALTLGLARALGAITAARAILAGLAVSALASALTSFLIFSTATGDSYREILAWLMGSLAGARWGDAGLVLAALAVIGGPLIMAGRVLDGFVFGDAAAGALGIDVGRTRWLMLGATALLTGLLVAVSGAIGFVGLILPHAVRLMVGGRHRHLLPLAALAGAVFMVWADTAARTLFDPRELPVGIVTALFGAPAFFLILLANRRST